VAKSSGLKSGVAAQLHVWEARNEGSRTKRRHPEKIAQRIVFFIFIILIIIIDNIWIGVKNGALFRGKAEKFTSSQRKRVYPQLSTYKTARTIIPLFNILPEPNARSLKGRTTIAISRNRNCRNT
jgi:hypothetical protein